MSYQIDLTNLLKEQAKLDKTIQENHHVTYRDTREKRLLALLVELGEFANTTRCFKFWSNKGMDKKERVLDEAADCLHFYLSIRLSDTNCACITENWKNSIEVVKMNSSFVPDNDYFTSLFVGAYKEAINRQRPITESLKWFLRIIYCLGFTWTDLEEAYYKKLGVNYDRQNNNY